MQLALRVLCGQRLGDLRSGLRPLEALGLEALSGPALARFRGVFALASPDLHERLQLDANLATTALSAHRQVDEERQLLALARS